jgi:hypothetical protein
MGSTAMKSILQSIAAKAAILSAPSASGVSITTGVLGHCFCFSSMKFLISCLAFPYLHPEYLYDQQHQCKEELVWIYFLSIYPPFVYSLFIFIENYFMKSLVYICH